MLGEEKNRVPDREEVPALDGEIKEKSKMISKLNAATLGGFLALGFLTTTPAMADMWNKKTEFQFNAPVEIPGRVLTPGKYVFELADSRTDRNMVEVFSEDSTGNERLVATILAVPDRTLNAPEKTVIRLEERHSDGPEAIHSWFYPGENTGWDFVYPKR